MKLSIIIPSYNEIENIDNLINEISSVMTGTDYELIIVDDNSPDGTWKVVETRALQDKNLRLIRRLDERGLRSAIETGIKNASGEIVAWMDCDFQHPPQKLLELKEKIEAGADVASASRFMNVKDGSSADSRLTAKDGPFIVRFHGFLSRLLNKTISLVCRSKLTDWTSGMVAFRKSVVNRLTFKGDHGEYLMFLLFQSEHGKFSIREVPYVLNLREAGTSKSSTTYGDLFSLGLQYLRRVARLAYYTYVKNPFRDGKAHSLPSSTKTTTDNSTKSVAYQDAYERNNL